MYRSWVGILFRKAIVYLDSNSICSKGEAFDVFLILGRCRSAAPQEDDNRAVRFWPWRLSNPAGRLEFSRTFIIV